jgi:preprotein translocase subunit YajC
MNQNTLLAVAYAAVVFGAMYFLWIAPQRKQRAKQAEMLSQLASGDEVLTAGGMYGKVREVEEDAIRVEVAKGVEVRFAKAAIVARKIDEPAADV